MSDSDEILFEDIYELHEVIGKILEIVFHFSQKACREERTMEHKPFWSRIWILIFLCLHLLLLSFPSLEF